MALQKLWVGALEDGRRFVALGDNAGRACDIALKSNFKMKAKLRDHYMDRDARASFREAQACLLGDEVVLEPWDRQPFGAQPVDALFWLIRQDGIVLMRLIKAMNQGNIASDRGQEGMGHVWKRLNTYHKNPSNANRMKFELGLWVRLSMSLDISRSVPWKLSRSQVQMNGMEGLANDKRDLRKAQFIDAHAPNIGMREAQALAVFPGFDLGRLRSDEVEAIERLCQAYGEDADEMAFFEVMALYRGGAGALSAARSRALLGFQGSLKHEAMQEWPRRPKYLRYLRTLRNRKRPKKLNL